MSSVTLGQENAELQQAEAQPTEELPLGKVPRDRITSHSNLERDIHMRYWAEQALLGRTLTRVGTKILVEPPIDLHDETAPPWANDSADTISEVSLFTETSKMMAPSFSLPVGPPNLGGSCPGSFGAMTTTQPKEYRRQRKYALTVIANHNTVPKLEIDTNPDAYPPEDGVCQNCYVSKGNHASYWGNNLRIVIRYAWTRAVVARGTFAEEIIDALDRVRFVQEPPAIAALGQRYFRIHDAGDFYDQHYMAAWWEVARAFDGSDPRRPRTIFWAPTRVWAMANGVGDGWVREINGGSRFLDNFVIRPSGYIVDMPGPDFEIGPKTGYASPTTVCRKKFSEGVVKGKNPPIYDWRCPAQESKSRTCASSPNPEGTQGCRVCWVMPGLRVNYDLH